MPTLSVKRPDADTNALSRLPHRPPFVLVDRILYREGERRIRTLRALLPEDPLLRETGHLPAPLLVEALAQSVALLLMATRPGELPLLLGIERAEFRGAARAGDCLYLEAEVLWLRRRIGKARGQVCDGAKSVLCDAEFAFGWHPTVEDKGGDP